MRKEVMGEKELLSVAKGSVTEYIIRKQKFQEHLGKVGE